MRVGPTDNMVAGRLSLFVLVRALREMFKQEIRISEQ